MFWDRTLVCSSGQHCTDSLLKWDPSMLSHTWWHSWFVQPLYPSIHLQNASLLTKLKRQPIKHLTLCLAFPSPWQAPQYPCPWGSDSTRFLVRVALQCVSWLAYFTQRRVRAASIFQAEPGFPSFLRLNSPLYTPQLYCTHVSSDAQASALPVHKQCLESGELGCVCVGGTWQGAWGSEDQGRLSVALQMSGTRTYSPPSNSGFNWAGKSLTPFLLQSLCLWIACSPDI